MALAYLTLADSLERWDGFAAAHPLGRICHTSLWGQVVRQAYGVSPGFFVLTSPAGEVRAGIPVYIVRSCVTGTRLVSAPCSQQCDALTAAASDQAQLVEAAQDLMKRLGARYWELRLACPVDKARQLAFEPACVFSTHLLDLKPTRDVLWGALHPSCVRRAIRRAEKRGLRVEPATSESHVRAFFNLYARMRHAKGLLTQPYRFFQAQWNILGPSGHLRILLAYEKDTVVSAIMLVAFGSTVTYEYGATEPGKQRLNASPLLLWTAIEQARAEGFTSFDFGRTDQENVDLYTYKARWGTQEQQLRYYRFGSSSTDSLSWKYRASLRSLLRTAVRGTSPSIGRIAGRLLYPHFL